MPDLIGHLVLLVPVRGGGTNSTRALTPARARQRVWTGKGFGESPPDPLPRQGRRSPEKALGGGE